MASRVNSWSSNSRPSGKRRPLSRSRARPVDLVDGDRVVEQVGEGRRGPRPPAGPRGPPAASAGPGRCATSTRSAVPQTTSAPVRSAASRRFLQAWRSYSSSESQNITHGAARQVDAAVARSAAPAGVLGEALVPDARIVLREPPHDVGGGIGRRIVDDDDLEGSQRLSLHRPDRPGQARRIVVRDDDDADVGTSSPASELQRPLDEHGGAGVEAVVAGDPGGQGQSVLATGERLVAVAGQGCHQLRRRPSTCARRRRTRRPARSPRR